VAAVEGAPPEEERSLLDRALPYLGRSWLFIFLIALLGYFWLSTPSGTFLTWTNLEQIALNTSEVILLAIGETFVIVTAGIDLSIGGILFFAAVCGGEVMLHLSGSTAQTINGQYPHAARAIPAGIVVCILAGTVWGFINGTLITRLKLPAFIVTLGTLNIAFALTHIVSNDLTFSNLPSELLFFGRTFNVGHANFTYGVVFMLVLYAVVWFALTQTAGGRHVYAVGDSVEAARLTGVNTKRVLLSVYTLAGLMSGIAALLLVARTELGDPNAGQTTENLDSITAVVLGGTSLFGGRGSIIGTLIGAVIVGVFRNGLTLIGVEVIYQYLVTGTLVILAVSVDQLTHRRRV
jgi:fructose transport system permease protein